MPFTTPPPAPNRNNPSTFSAYMDAFLAWLVVFWQELNNSLQLFSTKGYATLQGSSTANALVLTAGHPPGSIATGTKIRFRAAQANTGAATINLDGTGARQCRTITGAVLPPGYIRTDAETEAVFDGTRWVLDRLVERGSNSNGQFRKFADGRMECFLSGQIRSEPVNVATGEIFMSELVYWTFPQNFATTPFVVLSTSGSTTSWTSVQSATGNAACRVYRATSTPTDYALFGSASGDWY